MTDANNNEHYNYNSSLKQNARSLRQEMTKAEACLWKYVLRAGSMKGYTFNRQRPILHYIADFMCKQLRLVIEIDGITHHDEVVEQKDKIKQSDLEKAGFTVLRFSDGEVLNHIHVVRHAIETWIEEWEEKNSIPPPNLPKGRTNTTR